MREKWGSVKTF